MLIKEELERLREVDIVDFIVIDGMYFIVIEKKGDPQLIILASPEYWANVVNFCGDSLHSKYRYLIVHPQKEGSFAIGESLLIKMLFRADKDIKKGSVCYITKDYSIKVLTNTCPEMTKQKEVIMEEIGDFVEINGMYYALIKDTKTILATTERMAEVEKFRLEHPEYKIQEVYSKVKND